MKQYNLGKQEHYRDIRIRGDELPAAGFGEEKLLLFKIVR